MKTTNEAAESAVFTTISQAAHDTALESAIQEALEAAEVPAKIYPKVTVAGEQVPSAASVLAARAAALVSPPECPVNLAPIVADVLYPAHFGYGTGKDLEDAVDSLLDKPKKSYYTKTMHTITIAKKLSGTGSIHDLASEQTDITISFNKNSKYAVVFASYYGMDSVKFSDVAKLIAFKKRWDKKGYTSKVVSRDGMIFEVNGDQLVSTGVAI
jgi:hypothetical protein